MKDFNEWIKNRLCEAREREEHLQWAKDRAIEYLDRGDIRNAITSFMSDLGKHADTRDSPVIGMGMMIMQMNNEKDARDYILGTN